MTWEQFSFIASFWWISWIILGAYEVATWTGLIQGGHREAYHESLMHSVGERDYGFITFVIFVLGLFGPLFVIFWLVLDFWPRSLVKKKEEKPEPAEPQKYIWSLEEGEPEDAGTPIIIPTTEEVAMFARQLHVA